MSTCAKKVTKMVSVVIATGHMTLSDTSINTSDERRKYYKHILKAKQNPKQYISLIIDGMDQQKTQLPRFWETSKSTSSMIKLQTHLVGVIVHGRGQHAYLDFGEVPHDSNLTCAILLQTLLKYKDSLPPVMYLQMDNCVGENKNKYVFALCSLLIELDIFKKIKVSYLPVGHTHEDIDQLFSRISLYIGKFTVPTVSKLLKLIPLAYQKLITTAERLLGVFDMKSWVLPYLNTIHCHTAPHVFKFTRQENGKACLQTKQWASTGESWQDCDVAEDSCPNLLLDLPQDHPKPVQPNTSKLRLPEVIKNIRRCVEMKMLNASHEKEWDEIFNSLREEEACKGDVGRHFPLNDLLLGDIGNASKSAEVVAAEDADDSLSDDDIPLVQVQLGKKKKTKKQSLTNSTPLEIGKYVATYVKGANNEYANHWPQVGKILSIDEDKVSVVWHMSTNKTVGPSLYKVKGKCKRVPWTEEIPKHHILGNAFDVNVNGKFPRDIENFLKAEFNKYFEDV